MLDDSRYVFAFFILLALVMPQLAPFLKPLIVPLLIVMMTFSLKDISFHHIRRDDLRESAVLLAINYLALTAILFGLIMLMIEEPYRNALFILAMMPPAIGIISLTYLLGGDIELAFITEFSGYIFGMVFIPLMAYFLFGSTVSSWEILKVLLQVVILPFALSQLIHQLEHRYPIPKKVTRSVINLCFGISFYIILGINRDLMFARYESLPGLLLFGIIWYFGLTTVVWAFTRKHANSALFTLFGTFKNGGLAVAVTILLFGIEASYPLAIIGILGPLQIIFVQMIYRNVQHPAMNPAKN